MRLLLVILLGALAQQTSWAAPLPVKTPPYLQAWDPCPVALTPARDAPLAAHPYREALFAQRFAGDTSWATTRLQMDAARWAGRWSDYDSFLKTLEALAAPVTSLGSEPPLPKGTILLVDSLGRERGLQFEADEFVELARTGMLPELFSKNGLDALAVEWVSKRNAHEVLHGILEATKEHPLSSLELRIRDPDELLRGLLNERNLLRGLHHLGLVGADLRGNDLLARTLKSIPGLESLTLDQCRISASALASAPSSVTRLSLAYSYVDAQFAYYLNDLRHLRSLNVYMHSLSDPGVSELLSKFPKLVELDITPGSRIREGVFTILTRAQLDDLRFLRIGPSYFQPKALPALLESKPKLVELYMASDGAGKPDDKHHRVRIWR